MKPKYLVVLSSLVISLTGCASEKKQPATADAPPKAEAKAAQQLDEKTIKEKSPDRAIVEVSASIREACGIPDTDAHFDYASAALKSKDHPTLDLIAECFTTGPLAGRKLAVIGHADPRGDDEYNMLLGENRAQNVAKALTARKVPATQLATTSRGEMDASGDDEESWARDRRVQLELGE